MCNSSPIVRYLIFPTPPLPTFYPSLVFPLCLSQLMFLLLSCLFKHLHCCHSVCWGWRQSLWPCISGLFCWWTLNGVFCYFSSITLVHHTYLLGPPWKSSQSICSGCIMVCRSKIVQANKTHQDPWNVTKGTKEEKLLDKTLPGPVTTLNKFPIGLMR